MGQVRWAGYARTAHVVVQVAAFLRPGVCNTALTATCSLALLQYYALERLLAMYFPFNQEAEQRLHSVVGRAPRCCNFARA